MKLIESRAELVQQQVGLEGVYKQIEICGRTCYKSLDKMTEDSAKGFVERMIKSNHTAMLEQGTVYLKIPYNLIHRLAHPGLCSKYFSNPYTRVNEFYEVIPVLHSNETNMAPYIAVTTNYRVLVENGWLKDLKYQCEPTVYHERRYTFKFTTDRGVSHELVRHRVFSFAQESTRYCNYSKDKFGNELTFIVPSWATEIMNLPNKEKPLTVTRKGSLFMESCAGAQKAYLEMLKEGATPQEARQVLPNALKTEICMTGFASDWRFFFDLRYYGETGKPHPDMELLASKAREELIKAGLWDDIIKYPTKFDRE